MQCQRDIIFIQAQIGQTVAAPFFLIVWTPIIEEAKKLCRTSQLLTFSFKQEFMSLVVVVLDEICTVWPSWNSIVLQITNMLLTSCQVFMLYRVSITKEIILSMPDA